MATVSEIRSLEDIQYKSKVKLILRIAMVVFLFSIAFMNSFPIGEKIKTQLKAVFRGSGCNPDFEDIRLEFFFPKIVVSNLTLPASCLDKDGAPFKFDHLTLNWHVINFSPIGIPFRLDTEFNSQPLSIYYVFGINQQLVRLKDQKLDFHKLERLLGNFRLDGAATVDLSLLMSKDLIKELGLKAVSKNFVIPAQTIEGFSLPPLRVNDFYLEASSEAHPKVRIDKLIMGDSNSPIRANFKGRIDLVKGNIAFSPVTLTGELALSEKFKESMPLVDMMFQPFPQKDGFYQVKLGGTLGAPKPLAP